MREAKLGHELSGMLFPWERATFGDRTEKLKWWQKAYWVGFACAPCNPALWRAFAAHAPPRDRCVMSYWVAEKSYNKVTTGKWHGNEPRPRGAPKPKPKPTLVKSRVNDAIRGTSFVDDEDDPFEGLSPAEIEARPAGTVQHTRALTLLSRAGNNRQGGAYWGSFRRNDAGGDQRLLATRES